MQMQMPGAGPRAWYNLLVEDLDAPNGLIYVGCRIIRPGTGDRVIVQVLNPDADFNGKGIKLQKIGVDQTLNVEGLDAATLLLTTDPGMTGAYVLFVPGGLQVMMTRHGLACAGMTETIIV